MILRKLLLVLTMLNWVHGVDSLIISVLRVFIKNTLLLNIRSLFNSFSYLFLSFKSKNRRNKI